MTVPLWRIATMTPKYAADDMSETGAKNTGGRWNPVGMAVKYSSENIAPALTVEHLRSGGLPLNRYLIGIDVPDGHMGRQLAATERTPNESMA